MNILLAAADGNLERVKYLLNRGASRNKRGLLCQDTPLHRAASHGRINVARLLLQRGSTIDPRDVVGLTPLHYASGMGGNVAMIRFLVERGAHVEARSETGETPLHRAIRNNEYDNVQYLVQIGANVNAQEHEHGDTPLHLVARYPPVSTVAKRIGRLLILHGADPVIKNNSGLSVYSLFQRRGLSGELDRWLRERWTLIRAAVARVSNSRKRKNNAKNNASRSAKR